MRNLFNRHYLPLHSQLLRIALKEDGMRKRLLWLHYEQIFIDDRTAELQGMTGLVVWWHRHAARGS